MEILAIILIPVVVVLVGLVIFFAIKAYKKSKAKLKFGNQELPEFEDSVTSFPSITVNKEVDEYAIDGTTPNTRKAKKLNSKIPADTYPCGGPVFCINKEILVQIQMSTGAVKYIAYIPANFDSIKLYEE